MFSLMSVFLSQPFWFFFQFFFASSPWKSVTNYVIEWMRLNFDVFPGFQHNITLYSVTHFLETDRCLQDPFLKRIHKGNADDFAWLQGILLSCCAFNVFFIPLGYWVSVPSVLVVHLSYQGMAEWPVSWAILYLFTSFFFSPAPTNYLSPARSVCEIIIISVLHWS